MDVSIPGGEYDVTLVSYDEHSEQTFGQSEEQWKLEMFDDAGGHGNLVFTTNVISDLPDDRDYFIEKVNVGVSLPLVKSVQARHKLLLTDASGSSQKNSIHPVCAAFDTSGTAPPSPKCEESDGGLWGLFMRWLCTQSGLFEPTLLINQEFEIIISPDENLGPIRGGLITNSTGGELTEDSQNLIDSICVQWEESELELIEKCDAVTSVPPPPGPTPSPEPIPPTETTPPPAGEITDPDSIASICVDGCRSKCFESVAPPAGTCAPSASSRSSTSSSSYWG